ncbi:MAG: family 16 glycosylhydrolase [Verrucomicrobia bacterium]|nr:family 16 glycosylhydrolase [Verrucomicrobiota bacterium]
MNLLPFLARSLPRAAAVGATLLARATPPTPDYELLFADEFDSNQVNARDWTFRTGPRTGTGINGLNLARNVRVADGHLIVVAKHETVDGVPAHTGGGLISRHRFGYGYYECRSRPFMGGRGVHTAFWQRGMGGPENNSIFEIDSHEIDSTQKIACNNLYVDISTKGYLELAWPHRAQVPLQLPPDGWWIDAYEYTPDGVIFYDHGKVVARADFPNLVAQQNVWLTALNGVGPVDTAKLPGETRFDYFRFYARDYPGANLLANGGFEYNQDKVDLQRPVAWREEGDTAAARVVRGEAAHGDFKLRHESERTYSATTAQTLQFIRNGDYELRARVRRGGQHAVARITVSGYGGGPLSAEIPDSSTWTTVRLPRIPVTTHGVTVAITSQAGAGDWLEIDEVQFMKPPRPGQEPRPSRSFAYRDGEALWQIAGREPIVFSGDEKFYFFGRNCGQGDAMTASLVIRPRQLADTVPMARLPKSGEAGWAIGLTTKGDVFFRLGSHAQHRDIVAPAACRADVATRVTCVFDRGTAMIYVDGVLRQRADGLASFPRDTTAPGRLGANSGLYEAVGDVTLTAATPPPRQRFRNFAGTLGDIRIYNRALGPEEIARAGAAAP